MCYIVFSSCSFPDISSNRYSSLHPEIRVRRDLKVTDEGSKVNSHLNQMRTRRSVNGLYISKCDSINLIALKL